MQDRERLEAALAEEAVQLAALRRQHDEVVAASRDSNADDEHDPEGATIAFERSQIEALLDQSRRHLSELDRALRQLAEGHYGMCENCGAPIAPERLAARPTARTCIACAARPGFSR